MNATYRLLLFKKKTGSVQQKELDPEVVTIAQKSKQNLTNPTIYIAGNTP